MRSNTYAYRVDDGIYINLTNQCTNACAFCIRNNGDGAYGSNSLWLEKEPSAKETLEAVQALFFPGCKEFVFCGYGEPTYRLDDILWLVDTLKERFGDKLPPVRINTNGHANLINGRNVCPELKDRIHTLSISLNSINAADYVALCHPIQGEVAYQAMLDFAAQAANYVPTVVFTIVDKDKTAEEIQLCKDIAANLGVKLRIRSFIDS